LQVKVTNIYRRNKYSCCTFNSLWGFWWRALWV